jgi:hypothetical protein
MDSHNFQDVRPPGHCFCFDAYVRLLTPLLNSNPLINLVRLYNQTSRAESVYNPK